MKRLVTMKAYTMIILIISQIFGNPWHPPGLACLEDLSSRNVIPIFF